MKNELNTFLFMAQVKELILLFDFSSVLNTNIWKLVNDDVMGGKSKSSIYLKENKGVFQGEVSLENNGGFAMIQMNCEHQDVLEYEKIVVDLKGDGKVYQFRIKEKNYNIYSYVQSFKTSGKDETIELYLKDFAPYFRGVKLDMPNFQKNIIQQIGILIGNKKGERFKIEINKITLE